MKALFILLAITISSTCFSQIQVSGKITDNKSKPIAGASITIKDSYDGATSDSLGVFHFKTSETGKQIVVTTAVGYEDHEDSIYIAGDDIHINVTLHSKAKSMDAVVITAGAFAASDESRSAELSTLDVLTTASANADITGALQTLPGTQQVGETEGLFVRGGTADESKIYIDGTVVNNFYYTSEPGRATRGRFSPALFKGTVFSSGGYSAMYGQALSSVLLLESIDMPTETSAAFGISFLSGNAGLQKLAKNKKSSWGINYGYANLALAFELVPQRADYTKAPVSHEVDANYRIKTSSTGVFKYYGYLNHLKVAFRYPDIDLDNYKNSFHLKNLNTYHNISWKEKLGNGWGVRLGSSYSNNRDDIENDLLDSRNNKVPPASDPAYDGKSFQTANRGDYFNGRWTLEKKLGGLSSIRLGNELLFSNERVDFSAADQTPVHLQYKESLIASYLESDIYLTQKLALRAGARSEHSNLLDKWNLSPRLSLAYRFPDRGQISMAYGIFYQNPSNKYLPSLGKLHFQQATHYILQYQKMVPGRILRAEVFYKKYDDLLKANSHYGKLTAINNDGFGDAKGLEIFWRDKKSLQNFDYWISYSYLDTKRDFLNYPRLMKPPFATAHTASVVMKKIFLPLKTQFNMSYTFASGRPYYDIYEDVPGHFSIRQQGTTKNFNNLSVSFNYLPQLGKRNARYFSVIVLSVNNIAGFKNVYSYNFSADGTRKVAVEPPSTRFVYLGYFISLGLDRTQEAIDSQL